MDMGYDDSNNVCIQRFRNLGIFKYLLYTVHKIDFEGRFLYKIRHAGPVCAAAAVTARRAWMGSAACSGSNLRLEIFLLYYILLLLLHFVSPHFLFCFCLKLLSAKF